MHIRVFMHSVPHMMSLAYSTLCEDRLSLVSDNGRLLENT
jgi:hypothetical protein